MTTMSPFRTQLENAVNARHSRLNPVHREVGQRRADPRPARRRGPRQHYQYVSQFARWCATVYGDCPDSDARDFLLENIIEEESGTKHVDLLIRFAEACGVSRQEVETRAPAADHPRAHRVVLRDVAQALPRRGRRAPGGARVPGAGHLQAQPAAAQDPLRLHRPRGGVLRHPHRGRRGPRRARLPDRRAPLHDARRSRPRRWTPCARRPRCAGST